MDPQERALRCRTAPATATSTAMATARLSSGARLRVLHVYKDVFPSVVGGIEKQIDMIRRGMPDVDLERRRLRPRAENPGRELGGAARGPGRRVRTAVALGAGVAHAAALGGADPRGRDPPAHAEPGRRAGGAPGRGTGRPIVASYHADIVRQARFERAYSPLVQALPEAIRRDRRRQPPARRALARSASATRRSCG